MNRAIVLLIALLIIPAALGLGVSPARITLGPQDTEFTFRAITDGTITVHAEGDLAQYITFEKTAIGPGEEIRGRIAIPADITPGTHAQQIVITAAPASGTAGGQAQVAGSLHVKIPYPAEYLDADWSVSTDPGTGTALITVTIENQGSVAVTPQVTLAIAEENLRLQAAEVAPGTFSNLQATYTPRDAGVYDASLLVAYADRTIIKTKTAQFGTPRITITNLIYNEEASNIKPVDISGTTGWNRPLNMTVALYMDNDTVPTHTESVMADSGFSHRIYMTTGRQPSTLRAIVSAEGSEARKEVAIGAAHERQLPWTFIIIGASTAALLLVLWRMIRKKY